MQLFPRKSWSTICWNERHPRRAGKARFFRICGYDSANAGTLAEDLRRLVVEIPVSTTRETPYGIHYVVEGPIRTPSGRAVQVATVWLLEEGSDTPRLITAYPGSTKGR